MRPSPLSQARLSKFVLLSKAHKKRRKSAVVSGGTLEGLEISDFFSSGLEGVPQKEASSFPVDPIGSSSSAAGAASASVGGAPRTNIEPVELSEEEFQRWVDVGQAMSPEMQREWMSGDVKF